MSGEKQRSSKRKVKESAAIFLENLAAYENGYALDTDELANSLYDKTDMTLDDLVNLVQTLTEII